jgi:VanZ family protein
MTHIKVLLFIFLAILTTAFIFYNSIQNGEVSHAASEAVIESSGLQESASADNETLDLLIRKSAHACEFALLGMWVSGAVLTVRKRFFDVGLFIQLFTVLVVGVTDEYIQTFSSGRTSTVSDILIDFAGGVAGIIFAGFVFTLIRSIRRKKKR